MEIDPRQKRNAVLVLSACLALAVAGYRGLSGNSQPPEPTSPTVREHSVTQAEPQPNRMPAAPSSVSATAVARPEPRPAEPSLTGRKPPPRPTRAPQDKKPPGPAG